MGDLFASFNPNTVIFSFSLSLNWLSCLRARLLFPQIYWIIKRKSIKAFQIIILALVDELQAAIGAVIKPGLLNIFLGLFITIIFGNALGLLPYVFTASRHLSYTLALALPLWLGYIVIRLLKQFNSNIAHLVPEGTPSVLIPLMVIIESVRLIIRPFTLAVRLGANIIAGHLLLTLLGRQGFSTRGAALIGLIVGLILLITLECAVACIQAYVFTILSSLYLREHNSLELNNINLISNINQYINFVN